MLHAVLDAGKSGTIHAFESLYGQFSGTYGIVAALANVTAILGDVLDIEQMAECFSVEYVFFAIWRRNPHEQHLWLHSCIYHYAEG